jgi:hypothetical protein
METSKQMRKLSPKISNQYMSEEEDGDMLDMGTIKPSDIRLAQQMLQDTPPDSVREVSVSIHPSLLLLLRSLFTFNFHSTAIIHRLYFLLPSSLSATHPFVKKGYL